MLSWRGEIKYMSLLSAIKNQTILGTTALCAYLGIISKEPSSDELIKSVNTSDIKLTANLIKFGADINRKGFDAKHNLDNQTPLQVAIRNEDIEMVKELLSLGAEYDIKELQQHKTEEGTEARKIMTLMFTAVETDEIFKEPSHKIASANKDLIDWSIFEARYKSSLSKSKEPKDIKDVKYKLSFNTTIPLIIKSNMMASLDRSLPTFYDENKVQEPDKGLVKKSFCNEAMEHFKSIQELMNLVFGNGSIDESQEGYSAKLSGYSSDNDE